MLPMSGCLGPFTSNVSISYQSISLNQGNGYNPALGKKATIHCANAAERLEMSGKQEIIITLVYETEAE